MKKLTIVAMLVLATALPARAERGDAKFPDPFAVQAEVQGLYDEISQATLQFLTESDVDMFHGVLYTPDWVFIDAAGHRETWPEVRVGAIKALSAPPPDSMVQTIQKISPIPDGASTVLNLTTVRSIVDAEGRYGKPGASHTITETTVFRDAWVHDAGGWKMKSRQQVGPPKQIVDMPLF